MKFRTLLIVLAVILTTGNIISQETKEIKVNSFSEVRFEGAATWVLIPSDKEKVEVETNNSDIFNYVEIENKGDALVINTTEKSKNISKLFKSVTIRVYFKSIEKIQLSGVGEVKMEERYSGSQITATLKGTGEMTLNIDCDDFVGNMHGTGSMEITGNAKNSIVRVEGVGSFEGLELITNDTDITVSGVGSGKVSASNNLKATINGVGSIRYSGDPKNKDFTSNGLGSIKEIND